MRGWKQADIDAIRERQWRGAPPNPVALALAAMADDGLNKTERAYRDLLELRKRAGEIIDYRVQAMTLKIGPDARYVPDFIVIEADRTITFVEVKGWLREDAQLRWRVARAVFPWFKFIMVRRQRGGGFEEVSGKRARRKNERPAA